MRPAKFRRAGHSAADLASAITGVEAMYASDFDDAAAKAKAISRPGDVIFTVGAGDVADRPETPGVAPMTAIDTLATTVEKFGELRRNERLARHTTFGIGGPADLFLTVRSADALAKATNAAFEASVPTFVLGSGSNILVADAGIRGLVLDNRARAETPNGLVFRVESGASFAAFARKMCRLGLEGLAGRWEFPAPLGAR